MEFRFPLSSDLITMVRLFLGSAQRLLRKRHSLTLAQFRTLAYIQKGAASTMTDVAAHVGQPLSRVSVNVAHLGKRGLVRCGGRRGPAKQLAVTEAGDRLFAVCRDEIQEEYEGLLAPLDGDQVRAFENGCLVTAVQDGAISYFGEAPDYVYSYLRAFYLSERSFTETADSFDLNLNQFRVLLALLEGEGPREYAEVRRGLLLPSATMADAVGALAKDGLVKPSRLDGRSKMLELGPSGRERAVAAAKAMDDCLMGSIRPSVPGERRQYVHAASAIVSFRR